MDNIYSVSRVTRYLRDLIESDPLLSDLAIRGELSNWTRARSGHCYFTLKDAGAEIRCVMWRDVAERFTVLPGEGEEVIVSGYISVYPDRGSYQFYVSDLQPVGVGTLYQRFEALKAMLAAEGLFDEARKRPLPPFPRRIGVVTSADAAALRDILNVLRRRHPLVEVLLSPTLVQGSEAPASIVRAIRCFERVQADLIIVARGGGSIEDLWAFNDEMVARAICACSTPVISGVGHETDYTIADFVADCRAPTPSAAAELAVPDVRELRDRLWERTVALDEAIERILSASRQLLVQERRALQAGSPERYVRDQQQRLDAIGIRLERELVNRLNLHRNQVAGMQARVNNLDPRATLARGYAIVTDRANGTTIRSPNALSIGQPLQVTVERGSFGVVVREKQE